MSSFFILEDEATTNVSNGVDKTYVDNQDKKLLDLACTRTLLSDLALNNQSIIGVKSITASNSATTRGHVDTEFAKKASLTGATFTGVVNVPTPTANKHAATKKYCDDKFIKKPTPSTATVLGGNLDMNLTYTMKKLHGPTDAADAATKSYVDSEKTSLKSELSTLMDTKIAAIPAPAQQEFFTYAMGLTAMNTQNSWYHFSFPTNTSPHNWMFCGSGGGGGSLNEKSYFILGLHTFDNDQSFPSGSMTLQYKLEAFDSRGFLRRWEFLEDNAKSYRIPGELIIAWNIKKYWKDFPSGGGSTNYKTFKACRLSVRRKWSGSFGNESNCVFQIVI